MNQPVALLGLGKMGLPIAGHLISAGYEVAGYDPSSERSEAARELGVRTADTPRDAVIGAEAVLVLVGFDHQVRELFDEDDDMLSCMAPGGALFLMSTIHPETSMRISNRAQRLGRVVADATMCRAEHAAVDGTLLLLFGGPADCLERWRPMLLTFGPDIVHVGDVGTGQIAKTINNVMLWSCVVANQELLTLSERLGVPQRPLIDALLLSSGANWALETWHKARPMPWAEDDMNIAQELAESVGMSIPLSQLVHAEMTRIKGTKNSTEELGAGSSMEAYVAHIASDRNSEEVGR